MQIRLFGSPAIVMDGRRLEHPSRKAMALLAYLAVRADEHISRSHLAGLLWADSGEEQARANLRQTLSQLRRLFREAGHDPLMVPFDKVILRSEGIEIGVRDVLGGKAEADPEAYAAMPAFLEGFTVAAPEFENWATTQRTMIQARLAGLLEASAKASLAAGQYAAAAETLSLAVAADPLQEALHRGLMEALDAQGQTAAALAQFETCRKTLKRELGIEPEADTRNLAAKIRARRLNGTAEPAPTEEFRRYPGTFPTLVFRSDRPDEPSRFPDAQTALFEALEMLRQAPDPQALTIAAVPETAQPAEARDLAENLAACTGSGSIGVDTRVYDQFRHWSPFLFERTSRAHAPAPANPAQIDPPGYRLVSEMSRHRLQVMPSETAPNAQPFAEFSVAVLPLRDRSPDAGDFALGDVLSEEITHCLSRFRNLTVVAPSAGQAFRAHGYEAVQARNRLGVSYLVDGSVFRSGERLRASVTLTDLRSGNLVLSDHFDGEFGQIFAHQSALIDRIATSIVRRAETAEVRRAERAPTRDMGAYEWYLRGLAAHRRAGISPENARNAFAHFTRAIEIDPEFARAYAWRICSVSWYAPEYFADPGLKEVHYALSIDEHDAEVQRIAGALHLYRGDYDEGIRHIERAVELNPSDAYLLASSAVYWAYYGQPENGLKHIERAMMLDPFLPVWCVEDHGVVLYSMEDHDAAIRSLRRLSFPTPRALSYLAASQIAAGDNEAARESVAKALHIARGYSVAELMSTNYYRREADKARLRERLNRAGLD